MYIYIHTCCHHGRNQRTQSQHLVKFALKLDDISITLQIKLSRNYDTFLVSAFDLADVTLLMLVVGDVPPGMARLAPNMVDTEYVAIRTPPGYLPELPWTLFAVDVSEKIQGANVMIGPDLGITQPISCEFQSIVPFHLEHIILEAPSPTYENLKEVNDLPGQLPRLVREGEFLENLKCRVRACEPFRQGLIRAEDITVSVVHQKNTTLIEDENDLPLFSVNEFLHPETNMIETKVEPLSQRIPAQCITPPPGPMEDLDNVGFLRADQLARLGVFSGDWILANGRPIHVYLYPEPNTVAGSLYLPPLLVHNLGSPEKVEIQRLSDTSEVLQEAQNINISRVASPVTLDRTFQASFLLGLREYFKKSTRLVKNGDILGIPVDSLMARSFFGAPEGEVPPMTGEPDAMAWFQVTGLPKDELLYVFSPTHTRMMQSGVARTSSPPMRLKWPEYYALADPPIVIGNEFDHVNKLRELLKASFSPKGLAINTTILLTSSKRGAGKAAALRSTAAEVGLHELTIDSYSIVDDSDAKSLGALKALLERAANIGHCLVSILHLEILARRNELDGRDTPAVNGLVEILDEYISKPGLVLAATLGSDPEKLPDSVRNRFKFEIDVEVPSEAQRRAILSGLIQRCPNVELGRTASVSSLSLQSAGLSPPDLVSIVRKASQSALDRSTRESVICQRGVVYITRSDADVAVSEARSKNSDAMGAPKIPNVSWEDVGGLDMVKGEILDTIDMPLKHPELFASGLKKRSGILFYGPPGTGKTLLAKAIATTFSLNFFSVKGPELLNMYIGESEANVRRVFQRAREAKPCVVFFDELDSVAPKRGNQGDSGGVMDRIVSQLLAELDGMSNGGGEGVFVISATNRPDLLDEALLRPGRFDKMLYLGVSDTHEKQRRILEALTRKFRLSKDVDLKELSENCPFTYTGADFYAMSSDAMLNAMTRVASEVDQKIYNYNKAHPEEQTSVRGWFQNVATQDDTLVEVTAADFTKAQTELIPSVSAEELKHYLRIKKTFEGNS